MRKPRNVRRRPALPKANLRVAQVINSLLLALTSRATQRSEAADDGSEHRGGCHARRERPRHHTAGARRA